MIYSFIWSSYFQLPVPLIPTYLYVPAQLTSYPKLEFEKKKQTNSFSLYSLFLIYKVAYIELI